METGAWLPWKWALRQRSDGKVFPEEHAQYRHLQRERVIEQWCGHNAGSAYPARRSGLAFQSCPPPRPLAVAVPRKRA